MSAGPDRPDRPRGGPPWAKYPQVGDIVIYDGLPAIVADVDEDSLAIRAEVLKDGGEIEEVSGIEPGLSEGQWRPRIRDIRDPATTRALPREMMITMRKRGDSDAVD